MITSLKTLLIMKQILLISALGNVWRAVPVTEYLRD